MLVAPVVLVKPKPKLQFRSYGMPFAGSNMLPTIPVTCYKPSSPLVARPNAPYLVFAPEIIL